MSLLTLVVSRIPVRKTKLEREDLKLSIEERKLNIEKLKSEMEAKGVSTEFNIEKASLILHYNNKIIKHKSNFD